MSDQVVQSDLPGIDQPIYRDRHYSPDQLEAIIATCPKGLPETPIDIQQADPHGDGLIPLIVDRRQALNEKLEAAAAWYEISRHWDEKPAHSVQYRQLSSIHKAVQRLLKAMDLPEGGDPDEIPNEILFALRRRAEVMGERIGGFPNQPPMKWKMGGEAYSHYHGAAQFWETVKGIVMLRTWAAEAAALEERRIGSNGQGNQGDTTFRELIGDLVGIWSEIFEQQIGTSVGKQGSELEGQATGPLIRFIQTCLKPLGIEKTDEALRDKVRVMFKGKGKGKSKRKKPDNPFFTTSQ